MALGFILSINKHQNQPHPIIKMNKQQQMIRAMIPQGVATFLPEAAYLKRVIEKEILAVFFQWGYQEIITPIFEYLDVVSLGMEAEVIDKGYKIIDRSTGRVMVLRPDVTPQVARMVAMLFLEYPRPIRLCYRENVFRHEGEHEGREREIFQVGGELVGLPGPEGDAEMISIVVQSLRSLGMTDFKVVLGQVEISKSLIEQTGLSSEGKRSLQEALVKKDMGGVKALLSKSKMTRAAQIRFVKLLGLMGGVRVLKDALPLLTHPTARKGLKNLKEVFTLLSLHGVEDRVVIDMGEIRGLEYYTGVFYEVFSNGVGYEIGRGGRYDNLTAKFGSSNPSTGFAFDLERLELALENQGHHLPFSSADLLLVCPRQMLNQTILEARKLRLQGYRVVQRVSNNGTISEFRAYAKTMGISGVIIMNQEKDPKVLFMDVETGRKKRVSLKEIKSLGGHLLWK